VEAQRGIKRTPSGYAQEGTAGHLVASMCLTGDQEAIEYTGKIIDGIEIEEDLTEAVQVYVDTIRDDKKERGGKLLIEVKFHLKALHPEFFGTSDCVRLGTDRVLSVYDAKFGRGEVVEVAQPDGRPNLQLGFYALGALNVIPVTLYDEIDEVELVVVQPRAWHRDGPVRRKKWPVREIEALGQKLLEAAWRATQPNAPLVPGYHCKFCGAASTCKALADFSLKAAQLEFSKDAEMKLKGNVPNPATMTPEQLAKVLEAAEIFETWLVAVRARAHIVAETTNIPGWKLVPKQARRKWIDDEHRVCDALIAMGLEEAQIFEEKIRSPAQLEKHLRKKERESQAFRELCPAVSSGLNLVRDSNPKPKTTSAELDFKDEEW
jgi:hypothetical protein